MSSFYGYQTDQDLILCDNMIIGNGSVTPIDLDTGDVSISGAAGKLVHVGNAGGMAEIRLYAHSDLHVPANKSLKIAVEVYSSDSHGSAAAPFWNNSSGWETGAHFYLLYKDANDAATTFKAGDLVTATILPQDLLRDRCYLQLRIQTDADLSGVGLDAFIHPAV